MNSARFRQLVEAPGPFASIYFEDSHDTQNAAAQLDAKWRELHRQLEDHGADVALMSRVERAVVSARPPVGRSGRGIVAGAAGVLVNEHLISPPVATVVRVSELPYVVPLLESGIVHTTYVLAAVDRVGADITLYQGDTVRSDTVDAGGYLVHKAAESASTGYGDPQHRGRTSIGSRKPSARTFVPWRTGSPKYWTVPRQKPSSWSVRTARAPS